MLYFLQSDYNRVLLWSLISTLVVSLIFVVFPSLDILVSRLFWTEQQGFYLSQNTVVVFASRYNYMLAISYLAVMLCMILVYRIYRRGCDYKHSIFLFASLMLGPGLFVNALLKSFWGRARPFTIEVFGGTQTFSPAWYISDQCPTNCSFVSGHASAVFALYAFALLFFRHKRLLCYAFFLITVLGLLIGFGRIVEGKHFLSDVLLAGHLVWLVALLCYFPIWKASSTGVTAQPNHV